MPDPPILVFVSGFYFTWRSKFPVSHETHVVTVHLLANADAHTR